MLFNSIEFFIFLPITFIIYWFLLKDYKKQNFFLLCASYFFYGWWDYRFLALIIFSSITDFIVAKLIEQQNELYKKRIYLFFSLFINLGFLGIFKYYNFFIDSLAHALNSSGIILNITTLDVILPVGISFYTFQTLSYTIDVYYGRIRSTNSIVDFFAFVSFFPQLVAGPIEKASNLLVQFKVERKFQYDVAKDGLRLILWGMFKKVAIADTTATHVDYIFFNYNELSYIYLIIGAVLFSFQIYCDFSGYSDIAIGTSKLFGFKLMKNFSYPYFSKDISEFWKKWHISLSSWFRDYVYFPLGGGHRGKQVRIRNIFIIFFLSGLWHGANFTFIIWGFIHCFLYLLLILFNAEKNYLTSSQEKNALQSIKTLFLVILNFLIITLAWIFFRANNITHAIDYIQRIFTLESGVMVNWKNLITPLSLIPIMVIAEWLQRKKSHPLKINNLNLPVRWSIYSSILLIIIILFNTNVNFIYFQF